MLSVILLFTGGAVDFSRRNAVRADLIESLDAAGLAIAQLDESGNSEMANLSAAEKDAYLKDYGTKFFHENFSHENDIEDFSLDFVMTEQAIKPVAQGEIKTLFLGIAEDLMNLNNSQFDTLSMAASTEITRRGSGPIELALVLDVTGSMSSSINGTAKIDSLKTAVDAMLDSLYGDDPNATSEFVTTSVVPFAAYVNSGGATYDDGTSAWDSAWGDTTASAYYHGAHFLHVDNSGVIDLNTKVNHFNLFNSISGESWDGCNEERPYPLDEIDVESGTAASDATISSYNQLPEAGITNSVVLNAFSSAPSLKLSTAQLTTVGNSKFVPLFQMEDPDCNNSACEWGSTNKTLNGITYKGNWFHNPSNDGSSGYNNSYIRDRYFTTTSYSANLGKYLPVVKYAEETLKGHNGALPSTTQCSMGTRTDTPLNTWLGARGATECGDDEYILRQAYVGQFDTGTSTYLGKLNQPNTISSSVGPNDNCPAAAIFANSQDKAAIHNYVQALSPGGNTNSAEGMMWGWRVLSPEAPFVSDYAYDDDKWQKAVVLMTDGFNTISSSATPWASEMAPYGYAREERMGAGVNTASEMRDEFDNKLVRICARMKAKGILVYAVTFGLDDADPNELATKKVFQACATDDEAPYYFDAPSGDDLEDAFADIASDLVQLHVSK
ncbi:MAG: hypothetical protein ABL957_13530 [Parvularculaceae bacterium]